jgi:pimeloyl-ACP methyl ester carboxylesterase
VSSLVQVLKQHVTNRKIVLVGHSGGGTLAMLMAEKLPNVEAVVTIAANLQVNKWAEYHHYSKLQGSLDPNLRKPLPAYIQQLHLYSPFDKVIRPEWIKAFSEKQGNSVLVELPVDGHSLAWLPFYSEFRKTLFFIDENKTGIEVD